METLRTPHDVHPNTDSAGQSYSLPSSDMSKKGYHPMRETATLRVWDSIFVTRLEASSLGHVVPKLQKKEKKTEPQCHPECMILEILSWRVRNERSGTGKVWTIVCRGNAQHAQDQEHEEDLDADRIPQRFRDRRFLPLTPHKRAVGNHSKVHTLPRDVSIHMCPRVGNHTQLLRGMRGGHLSRQKTSYPTIFNRLASRKKEVVVHSYPREGMARKENMQPNTCKTP